MKYKVTTIIIALCAVICSTVAVYAVVSAAGSETWSQVNIAEAYAYGYTFNVPDRTVTADGTEVKALFTVTFPSGKVVREKAINLVETGDYTVRYYAAVGSKQYSVESRFTVQGFGYGVGNPNSSVSYGRYTEFGADSTGIQVKLANGDKLTFTKLIDVSALSQKNAFVRFFITPKHQGAADFNKLTFTLTDSADDSKYVKFDVNRTQSVGKGLGVSWVMAGGNGQDMVGLEAGKKLHVNDDVGTAMYISFVAQTNTGAWEGPPINTKPDIRYGALSFDYASKAIYANSAIVSNLDSSDYYKDLWSGFTSMKVRLTVSASGYASATANFCITDVFGYSADELRMNTFSDEEPPEITVSGDYEEMPRAEIGRAYRILDALAYDDYTGNCDVVTEVVYGYHTDSPISVGAADGAFTPDRMGTYTIIYTATDGFGNKARKLLHVQATKNVPEIEIALPALPSGVELGKYVEIPLPSTSGGSGKVSVETAMIFSGKRTVIENGFRPETAGEYTIEYTATDYIGRTKKATFVITARAGDKPLFVDKVSLPPVYVSGGRYVLPELYVNDYTSGRLERVLCDVKVKDAAGERTMKSGSEYVPSVTVNGEKAEITYFYNNATYPAFNVPVIIGKENKTVFMSHYLNGSDVTVSGRDESGNLYTTGLAVIPSKPRAEWTFANALLAENASVTVATMDEKTEFGTFEFSFTDALNGKKITVTATLGSSKTVFSHGGNSYTLSTSVKTGGKLHVAYESGRVNVVCNDSSTISVPITEYDDGNPFDGFVSTKIYLGVATTNNADGCRYMVLSVSDNTLSYRNQDNNAPSFVILGDYGGKQKINSDYVIRRGVCGDVFAPDSKVELTVTAPDGSIVKDANGKLLQSVGVDEEYVIRLSSYGKYTLGYVISEVDWLNKTKKYNVPLNVTDEEPPVIEFVGEGTKEASVGDVIVMPKYKVSDNVSAPDEINVSVFVINAHGKRIALVGGSNSIKCEYAGKYTFIVYATDAAGNSYSISYAVTVV